jgi:hypothetical protein
MHKALGSILTTITKKYQHSGNVDHILFPRKVQQLLWGRRQERQGKLKT